MLPCLLTSLGVIGGIVYLLFNISNRYGGCNRDNERPPALWTGNMGLGTGLKVGEHGLNFRHDVQDLARFDG